MLGRGMRPHPNKENCLVLDYGGNITRLGFVNEVNLPDADTINENVPKVKICQTCDAIIALSSKKCKFCEALVVVKTPKDIVPLETAYVGDIIKKPQSSLLIKIRYSDAKRVLIFASSAPFSGTFFYMEFAGLKDINKIKDELIKLDSIEYPKSILLLTLPFTLASSEELLLYPAPIITVLPQLMSKLKSTKFELKSKLLYKTPGTNVNLSLNFMS